MQDLQSDTQLKDNFDHTLIKICNNYFNSEAHAKVKILNKNTE